MKNLILATALLLLPITAMAQDDWRDRRGEPDRDRYRDDRRDWRRDNAFEITPLLSYRWGGTIFAEQTDVFGTDVAAESSGALGAIVGIPIGNSGLKLELMASRQQTALEAGGGLFDFEEEFGDLNVTYYHAGVLIPFARSRNVTPFVTLSAGIANLDPEVRGVGSENRFSAAASIGVKVPIADNLGFRFETRGFFTSTDETDDDCYYGCYWNENRDFYQGEAAIGLVISF